MSKLETDPAVAVAARLRAANARFDAAIRELNPDMPPPPSIMEAYGQYLRAFSDGISEAIRQLARGWNGANH